MHGSDSGRVRSAGISHFSDRDDGFDAILDACAALARELASGEARARPRDRASAG
jgi:hypothetical protein